MINAYIYGSCTSCRKTEAWLRESGAEFSSRDYFRNRFTRTELATLLSDAGLSVSDLLSTRSKVYKDRQAEIDNLDDDAVLDLMVEEPTLLRRPLVIGNGGAVIGHNSTKLESLVSGQDR